MEINYELVDKFLKAITPLPYHFGTEGGGDPKELDSITKKIKKIDPTAQICYGITKMVIISSFLKDIVIKIPFNGYYYEEEWLNFCFAPGSIPYDYCTSEFEKYIDLKNHNLECFVAKTIFYKKIDNFKIFLQEKIIPKNNCYQPHQPTASSLEIAKKWDQNGLLSISSKWIANCIDFYGEKLVKSFLYYCNNIDCDILEDAHTGNYGYREDGSPALLDFSNFLDS